MLLTWMGRFDVNATCPSYACKNFNKTQITCKTFHVSDSKKGGGRKDAFSNEYSRTLSTLRSHATKKAHKCSYVALFLLNITPKQ